MTVDDIAKKYCDFINYYEDYLQKIVIKDMPAVIEEITKKMSETEKKIYNDFHNMMEEEYAPWKSIPHDNFLETIKKIFTNNPNEMFRYAKITNVIIDQFVFPASEELEQFYQEYNINRKDEEIFEDLDKYTSKEELNKKIFSKDTINLFDLYKKAEQLQADITTYFNSIEKEKELEEELEK